MVNFQAERLTQARIDELAEKCAEEQRTEAERQEYEAYVEAIDLIALLQDKARKLLDAASPA